MNKREAIEFVMEEVVPIIKFNNISEALINMRAELENLIEVLLTGNTELIHEGAKKIASMRGISNREEIMEFIIKNT